LATTPSKAARRSTASFAHRRPARPYPVVIYNHGGTDNTNGGNIIGVVTAAGWTAQPPGAPDGLG
jgi:hypothetical protein